MAAQAHRGLTGACGEYHVAAELSRRGWLATVTIKNAPGTDVLAQHLETGRVVTVQTKTAGPGNHFRLKVGDEGVATNDNEWYALVGLRDLDERPEFFLVPRNHVAAHLYVGHRNWLSKPGRGGHVRKDSPMRTIDRADVEPYRERWELLERPNLRVPYGLPEWVFIKAKSIGLPPGHPDEARARAGRLATATRSRRARPQS
jgi:hypothetical protein